jgi:hypothetical protein
MKHSLSGFEREKNQKGRRDLIPTALEPFSTHELLYVGISWSRRAGAVMMRACLVTWLDTELTRHA